MEPLELGLKSASEVSKLQPVRSKGFCGACQFLGGSGNLFRGGGSLLRGSRKRINFCHDCLLCMRELSQIV